MDTDVLNKSPALKETKMNSLMEIAEYFSDEMTCIKYLERIRWSGHPVCPYDGCRHTVVYKFSDGKRYKCAKCRKIFNAKVGTIFEDTNIKLRKWFIAIYLLTAHKKGISSHQLARDIDVTQKTAWFMLQRIRYAFGENGSVEKMDGVVEADETFIGGKDKNRHKKDRTGLPGSAKMDVVMGILERGEKVVTNVIENTQVKTMRPILIENIERGATLVTDGYVSYKSCSQLFNHVVVDHMNDEYVRGSFHTNTIEGFWSLLKRGIIGIYHSTSTKHLQMYVDEFAFRYNNRSFKQPYRFALMLKSGEDKRLRYSDLVAKD